MTGAQPSRLLFSSTSSRFALMQARTLALQSGKLSCFLKSDNSH
jgi:hypothetical protein